MTTEKLQEGWQITDRISILKESLSSFNTDHFRVDKLFRNYYGRSTFFEDDIKKFQDEIDFTLSRVKAYMEMKIAEQEKKFNEL